ncbi:hypothetical protein [Mycoplasma leonicaptivi]|nr:hypothetical protein [Mycoplasma leonicaptivi]
MSKHLKAEEFYKIYEEYKSTGIQFKLSVIYYTNALLLFKSAFFTKNL